MQIIQIKLKVLLKSIDCLQNIYMPFYNGMYSNAIFENPVQVDCTANSSALHSLYRLGFVTGKVSRSWMKTDSQRAKLVWSVATKYGASFCSTASNNQKFASLMLLTSISIFNWRILYMYLNMTLDLHFDSAQASIVRQLLLWALAKLGCRQQAKTIFIWNCY